MKQRKLFKNFPKKFLTKCGAVDKILNVADKNAAGNIEENIDRNGQLGTLKIKQQANVNIL